jgi:hypothetical protein
LSVTTGLPCYPSPDTQLSTLHQHIYRNEYYCTGILMLLMCSGSKTKGGSRSKSSLQAEASVGVLGRTTSWVSCNQKEAAVETAHKVNRVHDGHKLPKLKLQTGCIVCFISPLSQLLQLAGRRKDGLRCLEPRSLLQENLANCKLQHFPADSLFVVEQQVCLMFAPHLTSSVSSPNQDFLVATFKNFVLLQLSQLWYPFHKGIKWHVDRWLVAGC